MQGTFDFDESQERKDEGMDRAAGNSFDLARAQLIAVKIAKKNGGMCHADMVGAELEKMGLPNCLGPAAGSLFRGNSWIFTGRRVRSSRKSNHARELKVWQYKG